MKILTKEIDEFRSDLSDKVIHEYIVYLIDDNGVKLKAKTCLGVDNKNDIVNEFITGIVMSDNVSGNETPISFEDVSFQEFKNLMN